MTMELADQLHLLSAPLDFEAREVAVVLAAGHGKRIKSSTSKMLHEIWGEPTVARVVSAARGGLDGAQPIVVVGIKAAEVASAVAERDPAVFAYQAQQNGTGHAVACAIRHYDGARIPDHVYVFPGDMGLLMAQSVREFKRDYEASGADMMVMTGIFDGPTNENQYGRILRVPPRDETGAPSGPDEGRVIEIKEYKDILALAGDYRACLRDRWYRFTRQELLECREFNAGVYAFRGERLRRHIDALGADNAQGEIYLTDLIAVFNRSGLMVGATSPSDNTVVLGFNNKSVLQEMEDLARQRVYERLKDIVSFDAPDDFYIHDDVVAQIEALDREFGQLDIRVGKDAHIGREAQLNLNVSIGRGAELRGRIRLGRGVHIGDQAVLSAYPEQEMVIGDGVEILKGDIVRGVVSIGDGARLESQVRVTGSDDFPTVIGKDALIKGTTYIFGSIVEDGVTIEHSILKRKRIERIERKDGSIQAVRYYLPLPEGIDCIAELPAGGAGGVGRRED